MNRIALIPAAGRGSRMLSLTDSNPKAMLPLNNKPIIGHQLDFMIDNNFKKVVIVVGYQKEKLIKYVSDNYANKIRISFVEQKELNGLADAVYVGVSSLTSRELVESSLFISLGDIVPNIDYKSVCLLANSNSWVIYNIVEDYSRWCLIDIDEKGEIKKFIDKPKEKPSVDVLRNLVGMYNFDDIITLKDCLEDVIKERVVISGEFQLSQALEKYIKYIPIKAVPAENSHFDVGEVDDLNKTRENIARHFNSVKLVDGVIIKTSEDNFSKLEKEFKWYKNIPKRLKKYIPEFLGIDYENKNYKLEYIPSTPLQELFLYNLPSDDEWSKILGKIFEYIGETHVITSDSSNLSKANFEMLVTKTEDRVKDVSKIFDEKLYTINGVIMKNPIYHLEQIFKHVEEMFLNEENYSINYGILHGDLFFGNMLYDIEKEELKLVDPRGDYGGNVIKGDIRYDIAKLNHSINGYYDFIVNGLYRLDDNGPILNYVFYDSKQDEVKKIFDSYLFCSYFDKDEINLLTGLLFLTMIPLHSENHKNQTMQFIRACEFLNDFIK